MNCRHCAAPIDGVDRWGLFGFRHAICAACGRRTLFPLRPNFRVFLWVLLVLTVGSVLLLATTPYLAVSGAAGVVAGGILIVDSVIRRHAVSAAVSSALVTTSVIVSAFALVLSAGLSNGYRYEVEDSPAGNHNELEGIDLIAGEPICGDGDDYRVCVNMHIAMYNSTCTTRPSWVDTHLTASAQATCRSLNDFVKDVSARSADCGSGCYTIADASGKWGWGYLRPVPELREVKSGAVRHTETCWFRLGPVRLGSCPR